MDEKIFVLTGLKIDNMENYYKKQFNRWRYENSSEVMVNGEPINDEIERLLLMFPDENGNPNIKKLTVSDTTKDGFPLTENTFISEQLRRYEPILDKTIGSGVNRETNIRLSHYIDFLKLKQIHSEQRKDWSNMYNKLINVYFKDATLNDFNEVLIYHRLPNGKEKIKWLGHKNDALYFQKNTELTVKQLNECFIHNDGTSFKENNRLATNPEKTFTDIFKP